jgi:hypothetical protein
MDEQRQRPAWQSLTDVLTPADGAEPTKRKRTTKLLPVTGGILWISGNPRRGPGVLTHAVEGIRRAGRRSALLEIGGLPPDYPSPPDWVEARYLEVCLLHVHGD